MNRVLITTGGLLALFAGILFIYSPSTQAANNRYTFTARGIVTHVDAVNKTIKLDVTKAPGKALDDLEGKNKEFKVSDAIFYKRVGDKDQRVTMSHVKVGQEVGIKGAAKDDDTYVLTFVRVHDRSFSVVGLLQHHDKANKTLKISVISSTYKPSTYTKGTVITMDYTNDAVFRISTTEMSFNDIDANDQKTKVTGTITNSSTWDVKTLFSGYKKNS